MAFSAIRAHAFACLLCGLAARADSQQLMRAAAPALTRSPAAPASGPAVGLPDAPQPQALPQSAPPTSPQPSALPNPPEEPLPGIIRGLVVDREGAVYEGVRITLTQPSAIQLPDRSTISDANGRFQFAPVPAGQFTLTVSSEGFTTQIVPGTLKSAEIYDAPAIVLPFAGATSEIRVSASQQEIAAEQVRQEEQQRVLGVIPNFYVSYVPNAPPLTKQQKFDLAWKSSIDPVSILASGFFAGIEQWEGDFKGYGQGAQGYGKRFAANYADNFIEAMIGGAILPSILKQDPRYFYKGTGSTRSRALYAIANSVICKGDNGHWQLNYSAILGGLAAAGISNLYYPQADRNGVSLTLTNTLIGTAGTAASNLVQEFLIKKLTPKLPNYAPQKP